MISIIIPTKNEAAHISQTLTSLSYWQQQGHELIVVDGGSTDNTLILANEKADIVIKSEPGRARQMNAGAALAKGQLLLFLHADTLLPQNAFELLSAIRQQPKTWGRFDVELVGQSKWLPVVASMINMRSRLSGIATGDQALFFSRDLFEALNGFADQPLMEDIEICRRAKSMVKPICFKSRVRTSARRWDNRGVWPTIFLMWRLRWRYWLGESPERLAKDYR